jgi:hypothetical protein
MLVAGDLRNAVKSGHRCTQTPARSANGTQPPSNRIKRDKISLHTLSTTQYFEATIVGVKFVGIKE